MLPHTEKPAQTSGFSVCLTSVFIFGLFFLEQVHEFFAGDGLFLKQVLGNSVQFVLVRGQKFRGFFVRLLDYFHHAGVDEGSRFLRATASAGADFPRGDGTIRRKARIFRAIS